MAIDNITLQCSVFEIINLPDGCCGQMFYYSKPKWWRWYGCWKKKYFQYNNNKLDLWSLNKTHKTCMSLKLKSNTRLTQMDISVHHNTPMYKFSIIKGGGRYHYTFASPRREKIYILWKNIYEFVSGHESFSTYIPD